MPQIENKIVAMVDQAQYLIGFAEMGDLIPHPYAYAISIARRLDDTIIDSITNGPTPVYRDHYHAVNAELNSLTQEIAGFLKSQGIDSQPVTATVTLSELENEFQNNLRYHLSHKMVATRAGLGWIGKSDLLITKKFGPRVRLASVLTNYPFRNMGIPIEVSGCGSCNLCITACPAQTATGESWHIGMDRDQFFNAQKCQNMCKTLSRKQGIEDTSICGICVSVCPFGRKHLKTEKR